MRFDCTHLHELFKYPYRVLCPPKIIDVENVLPPGVAAVIFLYSILGPEWAIIPIANQRYIEGQNQHIWWSKSTKETSNEKSQ